MADSNRLRVWIDGVWGQGRGRWTNVIPRLLMGRIFFSTVGNVGCVEWGKGKGKKNSVLNVLPLRCVWTFKWGCRLVSFVSLKLRSKER